MASGAPADGDKVAFKNGSATLGTAMLAGGVATLSTSTLSVGSHTITAVSSGDREFQPSSSGSVSETVQKAATILSINEPQATPGQPVTITANVISSSGAVPTGSVTFKNGKATLRGTLSGGNASVSVTFAAAGSYPIQATYAGNLDFLSTSGSGTVNVGSSSIVVNITNQIQNVQAGGSAITFNANVQNDSTNAGVTWTLSANNAACTPTCGTLSNSSPFAITYTPPATEPTGANANPVISATSVTDATKSDTDDLSITSVAACGTGNESILQGQYAFVLRGFKSNGVEEAIGSFSADGTGKITAAEADLNDVNHGPQQLVINLSTSSYSVGSDNRGCLTLSMANGAATFRFALGGVGTGSVATKGRIIAFQASA